MLLPILAISLAACGGDTDRPGDDIPGGDGSQQDDGAPDDGDTGEETGDDGDTEPGDSGDDPEETEGDDDTEEPMPGEPEPWPMFRGDLRNTGARDGTGDLAGLEPAWIAPVGLGESSPTLGQCDADEALEIVTFTYGGKLVSLDTDGSERFQVQVSGGGVEISTPTLADLDGDGLDEAILGSNVDQAAGGHAVHSFHCQDGSPFWTYQAGNRVMASAAVADLEGDGSLEVVVRPEGSGPHVLSAADGRVKWTTNEGSGSHGSPALVDIDGGGDLEVVIGGYFDTVVLDAAGQKICSAPTATPSTPAVADVNADGDLEVVTSAPGSGVFVFSAHDCGQIHSIPWPDGPLGWASSPAVAQLDQDPALEIVATNGKGDDAVYVYDGATGGLEWRFAAEPVGNSILDMEASPVVADLDGDQSAEVVVRSYNGFMYVLSADGSVKWKRDFAAEGKSGNVASTPAIADLDADGLLELVVQEATGKVYLFE
jgi:hypothetical protein